MRTSFVRLPHILIGGALVAGILGAIVAGPASAKSNAGFTKGTWDHKAIGALTFSPDGVLFFADDQAGAVYGVDLGEKAAKAQAHAKVPDLGAALAGRLGTTPAGIRIKDIAVSPISHVTYISVRKTDGTNQDPANPANYALFAVDPAGTVSPVDLSTKAFGKVAINGTKAFGRDADARIISDLAYANGKLLVAAVATEAFKSNLYSVPVPFRAEGVERYATSIFHVNHKRQETASPIQTLTVYRDNGKDYLMAAYICTPLVRFNLEDLKAGETVTGTTVAELGSRNQPMDLVAYGKPGAQSLLVNNTSFGILKVDAKIAKETAAVNQTAVDRGDRGTVTQPGIQPIDSLKGAKAYAPAGDSLVVVKTTDSGMALETMALP